MLLFTKAGDARAIKRAVEALIGDVSPSHTSASHAVNASSLAWSDEDKPFIVGQGPPSFGVVGHATIASLVVASAVPRVAKSTSGNRFTLLTNPSPTTGASTQVAKSTSPSKSDTGCIKHSGSR